MDTRLSSAVAKHLRSLREASGIDGQRLARIIGVSPAHLSRVERSTYDRGVRLDDVEAYADALGVGVIVRLEVGAEHSVTSGKATNLDRALSRLAPHVAEMDDDLVAQLASIARVLVETRRRQDEALRAG